MRWCKADINRTASVRLAHDVFIAPNRDEGIIANLPTYQLFPIGSFPYLKKKFHDRVGRSRDTQVQHAMLEFSRAKLYDHFVLHDWRQCPESGL